MGSELFIPGDDVLIHGKVKSVGGNYVVVTVTEVPDLKTKELIVFKESVARMRVPEKIPLLNYKRFSDMPAQVIQVDKYAATAIVRQLDENGEPSHHKWMQDLDDVGVSHLQFLPLPGGKDGK